MPRGSPTPLPTVIWCASARPRKSRPRARASGWPAKSKRCGKKVEDAEAKVEDFRAKSNLLVGTNNTTLSAQQLGDVNAQLAAARAQKADAEAKAKMIRDMLQSGQPIESSDILNSELIRRLAEQRVTLRAQLAEQSSTLLDNHPRIKELKAQIADLDNQIRTEAEIDRALARKRRQARRRARRFADGDPRSAQEPGGIDQRAGCAIARAGARRQVAARSAGILSRQISRGHVARHHQFDAGRRARDFARHGVEHSGLSEEAADGADRDLRDIAAQLRPDRDQGDFGCARRPRCRCGPISPLRIRRAGAANGGDCQRAAPQRAVRCRFQ